jgi:cytochrome c-type biogenesis protein CcmH
LTSTFLVLAALMAGAAILVVARPLLRDHLDERPALVTAVVFGLVLPLAAAGLYQRFSNYSWDPNPVAIGADGTPDVNQMLARLEGRLEEHPDDVAGWTMLGRSNLVLKNYPKAVAAFERAYQLTGGRDAEVDASLAEALAMAGGQSITTRGVALIEEALAADPKNPRALWYGGLVARDQGKPELARERWLAILDLGPPPDVARVLAGQITAIDRELKRPVDPRLVAMAATAGDAGAATGGDEARPAGRNGAAANAGPVVRLHVTVAAALGSRVDGQGTLFVYAQDPDRPGPPLAVKRFAPGQSLPLDVELSTADAMLPSRTLASVRTVLLVARYSRSGQPMKSSGDLYGEQRLDLGGAAPVNLTIDRVVP